MDDLNFPVFKDESPTPEPVSMDEFLAFVLFVNKEVSSTAARKAYQQRKPPTVPFILD